MANAPMARKNRTVTHGVEHCTGTFGDLDITKALQFFRQGKEPVNKTGGNRQGKKAADHDSRHHLGNERPYLYADQGAEQHAHRQGIEDKTVKGILAQGTITGGKNYLENIGADSGHGRDTQTVNKDGEGEKTSADTHDSGGKADNTDRLPPERSLKFYGRRE